MTLTKTQQVVISNFLKQKMSFSTIQKKCRESGFCVSKGTLSAYKKNRIPLLRSPKKKCGVGRKCSLSSMDLGRLKKYVKNKNPSTLKRLSNIFNVSQRVIRYAIKQKLRCKLVKKPTGQYLSEEMIRKRHKRSWTMYNLLKNDKWKNYVTVDEAWFYLSNAKGERSVQYISRQQTKKDASVISKPSHPKGVMVFMGMSYNGLTQPIFVNPGAKINSEYYINECIKPLISNVKDLYPHGNWIFHQDSAPAHTSKKTISFLRSQNVTFVEPSQWTPNSPDLAPCDFFLWGYMKKLIASHKVTTLKQLKNLIIRTAQDIPLEMIRKALKSWPKRCRRVRKNQGKHIEFI